MGSPGPHGILEETLSWALPAPQEFSLRQLECNGDRVCLPSRKERKESFIKYIYANSQKFHYHSADINLL